MSITTTTPTKVYRIHIKAPVQKVWDAITQPEWSVKYGYMAPVSYDLSPGGAYKALPSEDMLAYGAPDGPIIEGEVLECEPPHLLRQSYKMLWDNEAAVEPTTTVTWNLCESEGVTILTVTHEGAQSPRHLALVDAQIEGVGGGWSEILSDLKSLLETGSSMWSR